LQSAKFFPLFIEAKFKKKTTSTAFFRLFLEPLCFSYRRGEFLYKYPFSSNISTLAFNESLRFDLKKKNFENVLKLKVKNKLVILIRSSFPINFPYFHKIFLTFFSLQA